MVCNLAYQKIFFLLTILFVSYGVIVVLFAFIYLGASPSGGEGQVNPVGSVGKISFCDMDIRDHIWNHSTSRYRYVSVWVGLIGE